ncbi:hypothetical protein C8A05DRAFT_48313 [Staphylotrichum tortipilum]|uniref:Nephrocystin 3-like N-terminal domain-containing protein n=1 Tax=Staphylotrichum tortipilum TaxID=2831512 RepID=A0AAN6M9M5_9PEZI|nr:hypothetical protein C8A05DRAFT_48313 [Staphylotrichum longicolle]
MYNAGRDKSGEGTGAWLVEENKAFRSWESGPSSLLWLYGKDPAAGSGKTILSSSIINHLRERHSSDPMTALTYFYFSFSDNKKQAVDGMLASLLKQLCSRRPTLPSSVEGLLSFKERGERPDSRTLEHALTAAMSGFSAVHIVIDALDECPGPPLSRERSKLLGTLCRVATASPASLHMLCTSRKESDINAVLGSFVCADRARRAIDLNEVNAGLDHDIGLYIDSVLASPDFQSWPDEVKAEARFQYVALQFDTLRNLSSMPLIRLALQDLPVGLDDTYDRILLSIDPSYQLQVANTLKWLALCERPFELEQLGHIFILHPEPPALRWSEQLFNPQDTLKYLSCLVHTRARQFKRSYTSGTVAYLAHFSIKEYLVSQRIAQGPAARFGFSEEDAHLYIARCCLAYHFQRDAAGISVREPSRRKGDNDDRYWLDIYAAANWPDHLEKVPRARWPRDVCDAATRALATRSSALAVTVSCSTLYLKNDLMRLLPHVFTASRGFLQLTNMLLSSHKYLTQEDLDLALEAATAGHRTAVIDLLLGKGARIHVTSRPGAKTGAAAPPPVTDDLLDAAAEALGDETDGFNFSIVPEEYGWTNDHRRGSPLQRACYSGDRKTVQTLLDSGTDVNAQGGYYGTALQAACAQGSEADLGLVTLLLQSGADVNAQGGYFGSALQAAAASTSPSSTSFTAMLLRYGAEVNQGGGVYGYYGTPLQAAVAARPRLGEPELVILLLDHGANIDTEGGHYGTALMAACYPSLDSAMGCEAAQLLLRRGASAHARGGRFGNRIRFLLDRGADVNVRGGQYGFPLQAACCGRNVSDSHAQLCFVGVKFLLDNCPDLDVNAQGGLHGTALQAAAYWGQTRSVRALLEHGADVNLGGGQHRSALNAAIFRHFWDIVEILLEAGATPDCQLLSEPDEEWLARVREELGEHGEGAVQRYHVFWKKHQSA